MKKLILLHAIGLLAISDCTSFLLPQERLSSDQIVSRLIEKKKEELKKSGKAFRKEFIKKYKEWYPVYESKFQELKKTIPVYAVAGNLSYTMTPEEMTKKVKSIFKHMFHRGKIITRDEFKKYDQNKWFAKKDNLTRIWGANYLADSFAKNKRTYFKVPDYIIVIDDPKKIQVKISYWPSFPAISRIKGQIYAQRVNGPAVYPEVGFGFTDYSGPNILKGEDNNFYVIDTEYRSFYRAAPENELFKNMPGPCEIMCEFLKNRFLLMHDIKVPEKILEFSLV